MSAALRQAVQETSASLAAVEINSMSGLVDESLQTDRFIEQLAAAFGLLALVLASIGLYGVLSYAVTQRTNEIGVRMALGADRGDVLRMILGQGARLAFIGAGFTSVATILAFSDLGGLVAFFLAIVADHFDGFSKMAGMLGIDRRKRVQ